MVHECGPIIVLRAVVVKVVGFGIGDDGDLRMVFGEAAVRFVGLGHQHVALAGMAAVQNGTVFALDGTADGVARSASSPSPAFTRMCASMELVVVLPWAPATVTARFAFISRARMSLRCTMRSPASCAATISGLSGLMALENTTVFLPRRSSPAGRIRR